MLRSFLNSCVLCTVLAGSAQANLITVQASQDIWTTSVYSYKPTGGVPGGGLANAELRVGGWGDNYYSLVKFNLAGLPATASSATLRLFDMGSNGGSPTAMNMYRITSQWDWKNSGTGSDRERLWWADRPSVAGPAAPLPAPKVGSYYKVDVTNLYNGWQSGTLNEGVQFRPTNINNNFNVFGSSRASDPAMRPVLQIVTGNEPGTAPDFSFPIMGTQKVSLTTEAGGLSGIPGVTPCVSGWSGYTDSCHLPDEAFYSLDFDIASGSSAVVAAAGGTVHQVSTHQSGSQYYAKITIDHGNGYYSVYQEFDLAGSPAAALASVSVSLGQAVSEGQQIATLHSASGEHLHFQVQHGCST
jgi:hypothetical protein